MNFVQSLPFPLSILFPHEKFVPRTRSADLGNLTWHISIFGFWGSFFFLLFNSFCFLMSKWCHARGQQTWATSLDTPLSFFFGVLFFSLCTSILFPQRKVVPGTRSEDFCNTCLTHIYVQFFGSFFFSVFESILFPYRYVVPHYTPLFPPLRIPIFGLSRKSVSRTRFWSMGNIIAPFFFEIVLPMPHHRIYHYFGLFHFFGSNFFLFSSFLSFYLVSLGKWHHLTHLRFQLYSLLFFFFWLFSISTLPSSYYLVSSGK